MRSVSPVIELLSHIPQLKDILWWTYLGINTFYEGPRPGYEYVNADLFRDTDF